MRESAFSDVATITSASPSFLSSESRSPMLMPTFIPRWENLSKSSFFSDASAFRGTMYSTRLASTRIFFRAAQ